MEAINDGVTAMKRYAYIDDDAVTVGKISDNVPRGWAPLVSVRATHIHTGPADLGQCAKLARRVGPLEERRSVAVEIKGAQVWSEVPPLLPLEGFNLLRGSGRVGKVMVRDVFEQRVHQHGQGKSQELRGQTSSSGKSVRSNSS